MSKKKIKQLPKLFKITFPPMLIKVSPGKKQGQLNKVENLGSLKDGLEGFGDFNLIKPKKKKNG